MRHVIFEQDGEIQVKTGKSAEKMVTDNRNKNSNQNDNRHESNTNLLSLARMTVNDVFAELFEPRPADKFYCELVETYQKSRYAEYDLPDECIGRSAKQFNADDCITDKPEDITARNKKILYGSSSSGDFMESIVKALSTSYMASSTGLSRSYCRRIDNHYKKDLKKSFKTRVTKEHSKKIKKAMIKRTVSKRKLKNAQYLYTGRIENSVV